MNLNSSFKSAQYKFYKWATNWRVDAVNYENKRTPDLLDLITICQILGFNICHVDALDPHEISKLSCGEKGLKLNITCGHSGLRFTLEGVNDCSCSQKIVDSIRQIMVQPDPGQKDERYSKIRLLEVPEGEKLVIQTVLTHLVEMMHEAAKDNDQNQNLAKTLKTNEENQNIAEEKSPQKTKPTVNYLVSETPLKMETPPEDFFTPSVPTVKHKVIEKSPEVVISPCRNRSLDTLSGIKVLPDELPEPGHLKKEDASMLLISSSSPNISIPPKPSITSSPVANISILKQGYSKLLTVQELIKDVIDIFDKSQEIPKCSFDVSNIKASTESLPVKKTPITISNSDTNLIDKRNIKPLCRPSIRSTSSVKSTASTTTSTSTLTKPTAGRKLSENISPTLRTNNKPSAIQSGSKSQKFAHVKSTIPKSNTCKKM